MLNHWMADELVREAQQHRFVIAVRDYAANCDDWAVLDDIDDDALVAAIGDAGTFDVALKRVASVFGIDYEEEGSKR